MIKFPYIFKLHPLAVYTLIRTIGMVIACQLSFSTNQSWLWAIPHTFFGWGYVVYWVIIKKFGI